jgi:hypothetical protein
MTTIVTRLYADAEKANAAAAALHKAGATKDSVGVVAGSGKNFDATGAIRALGVHEAAGATYAEHVKKGAALVVCHAPWKKSYKVAEVMDACGPIEAAVRHNAVHVPSREPVRKWAEKAPPVNLLSGDTLVLSDGLFPRAVLRNHRPSRSVMSGNSGKANLITGTLFSAKIGMPMLTSSKGPRSGSMRSGPISSSLGIPTLTK